LPSFLYDSGRSSERPSGRPLIYSLLDSNIKELASTGSANRDLYGGNYAFRSIGDARTMVSHECDITLNRRLGQSIVVDRGYEGCRYDRGPGI